MEWNKVNMKLSRMVEIITNLHIYTKCFSKVSKFKRVSVYICIYICKDVYLYKRVCVYMRPEWNGVGGRCSVIN